MTTILLELASGLDDADQLMWLEPQGLGFFPCRTEGVYDQAYFDNYVGLAETPIGLALNAFRRRLVLESVAEHVLGATATVLDVGIGDGAFLRSLDGYALVKAYGDDINPAALAYLEERGQRMNLRQSTVDVVTFWDSLEHMHDPRGALMCARSLAIVSLPTFESAQEARASKHFKPCEHYWYFSVRAFRAFADRCGFDVLDMLLTENVLGREGITTFVLKRRPIA